MGDNSLQCWLINAKELSGWLSRFPNLANGQREVLVRYSISRLGEVSTQTKKASLDSQTSEPFTGA